MTIHPNAGRGADFYAWHAEATLRGGEVAPFEPRNPPKTLENAVRTALRDVFYRQLWAGYDRRAVDNAPELARLDDADEFFASAAVTLGLFTSAQAVRGFADARDALLSGCAVIVRSDRLYNPVKDRFGFCTPARAAPVWAACRGVSDNGRRPGLLLCGPNAPAGKDRVKLPHGVWFPVPAGCYFVDASAFDAHTTDAWAVA